MVNTLQERLIYARKLRGFSQAELARRAKCRQSTIGNIESGLRKTLRDLVGVARALDVTPDWLADGRGALPFTVDSPIYTGSNRYATHHEAFGDAHKGLPLEEKRNPDLSGLDAPTREAVIILSNLPMAHKQAALAALKTFVGLLNPPGDGQSLSMAA
jgi:transcriptional regulator with XRE-family HTH domain